MEVPEGVQEPTRTRLQFQSDAAEVQLAISKLMRDIQQFLEALLTDPAWKSPRDAEAGRFMDGFWKQRDRWADLRPPLALQPVWSEIGEELKLLGLVVEKLPALGVGQHDQMSSRLHAVQEEFRVRLDKLATREDKLLDEERRLHGSDHGASGLESFT